MILLRRLKYLTSHLVNHQSMTKQILETTSLMNKASSVTLGPNGRLVAIESEIHEPRITKDGVTVIKSLEFEDRLMNAIASLVKKAANNANKFSGDGTTTTTILTFELIRIANKMAAFEMNQKGFREGLQKGKQIILDFLEELSIKVNTEARLKQVAMIATNGDQQLSNLVSEAIFKAQNVKIQKSKSVKSSLQFTSGMKITRGIPHEMLVNKINKIQFNYPVVIVTQNQINQVKDILPAIEKAKKMKKPLVVFAEDISEGVSSMLYYNHLKKIIQCCPVRVPERGSNSALYLPKIAEVTNAHLFSQFSATKIEDIDFQHFGKCIKIVIDEFQTTITSKSTEEFNNCTILIGGNSESQIMERYDKAVDALNSTEGAKKYGIVPGGGISYLRAAEVLELFSKQEQNQIHSFAYKVLAQTLRQPLKTLLKTSEIDYIKQTQGWEGYNTKTKQYQDFLQTGILDSLLVSKNCVIDSVSIASMLLSLQLAVVEDTKYKQSDYSEYSGRFQL